MIFIDRQDAGRKLAGALEGYKGEEVIVYALPRGGVVLGVEIAKRLGVPLDLIIARKIGHPYNSEYAICAIAEEGPPVCNKSEADRVDPIWLKEEIELGRKEIRRRREKYLGGMIRKSVEGKTAIIVDDGIATGLTMFAAIDELKSRKPKKIVVAIPVTPYDTAQRLKQKVDELVSLR
ncbi:MAG: phosphoribosyl transferase, partial [Eubacteriaceae bacterium]|nr:phosphoribosyl transferase [Eubacteriaceae bacterium]